MDSENNPNLNVNAVAGSNLEPSSAPPANANPALASTAPIPSAPPASSVESSPISPEAPKDPALSADKESRPTHFQRFKALFTKENPHCKRNRAILVISLLLIVGIIIAAIVVAIISTNSGELAILDVTPTKIDEGVLGEDSHFIITTEHGSIEKVRDSIYLEPAIDYEVKEVTPGSAYEVIPASNLADNTVFNVDAVSNEVIAYKWAFQTKKDLSVAKIYPANGANYVSENTVIEFSFSYPNIEGVADHFSISPQVSGTLEQLERSWRFTPSEPLAKNSTYEITISAGLTYGDEIMTKDFHSSFSTYEHSIASSDTKNNGITLDGVSTFTESENPIVVFDRNDRDYFQNSEFITIEEINSADDYIKYLQGEQVESNVVGDFDFRKSERAEYPEAILNQTLPTGYYIFYFKSADGQNLYTADVEVNNLAAYAFESERDVVVWTAENGELQSGVKVNFKNQTYETGENGLLTIQNVSNFSDGLEYLKIGGSAQPLVLALKNFKNDLYPQGFIYTDRPLYAPNDTIKVWGYVPLAFFKDAPNRDNFSIVFDEIKQQVAVDSEGFFSAEIKLDNYKDVVGDITLNYNDAELAHRYIEVENYTLENYTYEFVSSKNYVTAGENIDFAVRVSHVTGFPAINKDIVVTFDGHDYYGTTNGLGEVSFSFPTAYSVATWDNASNYFIEQIEVKSGGAEYNKYSTDTTFFVFKNNLVLQGAKDSDTGTVKFTAKSLDLSKEVNTDYNYKNLPQTNFSGPAVLRFYEDRHYRYINGYSYNDYTKENVPIYRTDTTTSIVGEVSVNFDNGELTYNYPTDFKEPEENVYYSYRAVIATTDTTGRPAYSYSVYYHENYYLGEPGFYDFNAIESWSYNPTSSYYYNLYRFGLKDNAGTNPYSIGDTLKLGLYDYSGANVENVGQVLAITYQESIIGTNIFHDNTFDLNFGQNLYPGASVAGAYFIGGKFHRIAPSYFDYDAADSELSINIETDHTSYEPGDTVKAKVIVTRPDGSRASGKVNLSVVNEAIFSAKEDDTSILSSIYANKNFKSYSVSTYRDYDLVGGGGLGSASGGRSDFGDTIFFGSQNLSNGEAEFEFKLNDSITSFRLTALAVENGNVINAGAGTAKITSSLPLSISTVIPKQVKSVDDLVLNATSITSAGDKIDYTFTIEELGDTLTASAAPGQSVSVNFGKLDLGTYTVTITGQDSAGNSDKMVYTIDIVETAQEVAIKKTIAIDQETEITPAKNPIIVELYDEDTKNYLTYLDFLEANHTARLDTLIAYYKSLDYKNKYYNDETTVRVPSFDSYLAANGTLKPLENAEGDYILTALANFYMPGYFDLKATNYGVSLEDDKSVAIQKLLILASFREPVLLDLQAIAGLDRTNLSDEDTLLLGLAFAFIGDYDSAKVMYENLIDAPVREDLLAILSSFIDKVATVDQINYVLENNPTSDYLPFAMISFFENNEVDLNSKETVNVTINSETTQIEISPLKVAKQAYYSDDLSSLKLTSRSDDLFATYYYQGGISELGEDYTSDIVAQLENTHVGQTGALVLDISALTGEARNGTLNIALPSSLKFSATFSGEDGLYLIRNNNEYIKLSLSESYTGDTIRIPLYVAVPGNYELEPIIFTSEDGYHISNRIVFDAD